MENLSDRIKYFQSLKKQETPSSVTKTSSPRTTTKLKIPSIFVSSETQEAPKEEPKIINKFLLPTLEKNISISVDSDLNLLETKPKPITKSRSQEVIFKKIDDDIIVPEEDTEKRISGGLHKSKGLEDLSAAELDKSTTGLHKSKGFEDLPLATLENETIVPNDQILTPMEEEQIKPRILESVPKKIELTITDDTTIEFRKRVNQIKSNRTQSLIETPKKTSHQISAEKLFVEKLNEIKSKRRSAEFNSPRTLVFNFTKKNDERSQSVNNLNTINDEKLTNTKDFHKSSDDILLEVAEHATKEQPQIVEKRTKGLKIIPKEVRMRTMQEETGSSKVVLRSELKDVDQDESTKSSKQNEELATIFMSNDPIGEEANTPEIKVTSTENVMSIQGNEENHNDHLLTEPKVDEEMEKPPTPAPRKVSSPAFVQNEEYMCGSDLKEMSNGIGRSNAVENEEYMNSNDLHQLTDNTNSDFIEEVKMSVPVPAPRRRPVSNTESA